MFEPLEVKALSDYRIWIRYASGEEGEVNLSHLAGQAVFNPWKDEQKWKNLRIAEDGAIRWSEDVELCPDATYLKLTGKSPEETFPKLTSAAHTRALSILRRADQDVLRRSQSAAFPR